MTSQYETNLWSTHDNTVRLAEPISRCVRWRTQVFKIEGFVCKRFLPSPPPPPSFIFWLSFHFSRGQNRSFFAPKPNGNAFQYAGYLVHFFSTAAHFHFALVAASISHFVTAATKFSCYSSNKKMSLLFFISCSRSLSPFFSLSFPGRRLLSLFLCPSLALYSKFVDNESKVNTLDNTDTETISAFRFRLYLLFSKRFPAKITASCIWVAIPVDWVVLQWYACGEDGQTVGRAYGHVITKFYRRGRLLHFLTDGAPLRPLRARELLYHLTFFLLFPFL